MVSFLDEQRLYRLTAALDKWSDSGLIPCASIAVLHRDKILHESHHGNQNPGIPMTNNSDTIFRIYSMTKPIVSIALMMLYEKGKFKLSDPLKLYIPSFDKKKMKGIYAERTDRMIPIQHDIKIWHLLTHTSGISYGYDPINEPVDRFYTELDLEMDSPASEFIDDELSKVPLLFEPGTRWQYGMSTDIVGRLIEVISGQSLDTFLSEHIFEPLGMKDTSFVVPDEKQHPFASIYKPSPRTPPIDNDGSKDTDRYHHELVELSAEEIYCKYDPRDCVYHSGGAGLVSTLNDYIKFVKMLMNHGYCKQTKTQIISSRTLEFMTRNHLPNGMSTAEMLHSKKSAMYRAIAQRGVGFGLGFSVVIDDSVSNGTGQLASIGTYGWSGAADTHFWIDQKKDLAVVFMTQLRFCDIRHFDIRDLLYRFVYSSLVKRSKL